MSTFVEAVNNQSARTANGMKARASTANACVDLFFKIGASRGKDITPAFTAAYVQDADLASRIALWVRDVRGGAGERKLFRDILLNLAKTDIDRCLAMMLKVPELGRWDDLLIFEKDSVAELHAFAMIRDSMQKHHDYLDLLNRIETMSDEEAEKHLASLGIDQSEISS